MRDVGDASDGVCAALLAVGGRACRLMGDGVPQQQRGSMAAGLSEGVAQRRAQRLRDG